ncbi:hypothetical protein SAMN05428936_11359 [Pelagibacterium halotolerans]|nr:hypothetical protein SAMN05428936_11359 [Pelagibacterium halotolerans]
MKTTIPHLAHHGSSLAPSRGRAILAFMHGAILLAGIVGIGAALLLLTLVSWPIRVLRRHLLRRQ